MAEIALSNGCIALLDDEDFARVQQFNWRGKSTVRGVVYVFRDESTSKGGTVHVLLHRVILGAPDGVFVDHINGDPLDNRRCNLRLATKAQNAWNRRRAPPASGFIGVYERTVRGRTFWSARVQANGRIFNVVCSSAASAALVRDELAIKHHGEFAVLNFPNAGLA